MRPARLSLIAAALVWLAAGCASISPEGEFRRLKTAAEPRAGGELSWPRSEEDEAAVRQAVEGLLADGLTREEAVRLALLNNRAFQAELEEIGLSKAELVGTGLYQNPRLRALFRFPSEAEDRTNIELEASLSLAELWRLPLRREVASARLEVTLARLGQAALETAAEARKAFAGVYYLDQAQAEARARSDKVTQISREVERRGLFGYSAEPDVYAARVMAAEAEIALARLQAELKTARAHLVRVLGLGPDQALPRLLDPPPEGQPRLPGLEAAAARALRDRPDAAAARLRLVEAQKGVKLALAGVVKEVDLELAYEREAGGGELYGPGIGLELPIFDQNQAAVAAARFRVRQAHKQLQALEGRIREELSRDLARVELNWNRLKALDEVIIPARRKIVAFAETFVQAMQLNRLHLLKAEENLIQARLERLEALRELSWALADLERDLGGGPPGG